jgi:hypothetical protein
MFVLNPGGGGAGGEKVISPAKQQLWFFGQLGLYFVALRGAFFFFAAREERKALAVK